MTKIGCILMAAGNAARFGENKLLSAYKGKPVIEYALCAIPTARLAAVAVVSQYETILERARERGFYALPNNDPDAGVSLTIRLGMEALGDMDALLFMVADQPCLRRESVERELDFFLANKAHIVCMGDGARRGNPVVFPRQFFPELRALRGDKGGSAVYNAHPESLRLFPIGDARELFDVDSAAQLKELEAMPEQP